MKLNVDGQTLEFIPMHVFREQWGIPSNFNLSTLEPKDWAVGSMEGSSKFLGKMKEILLETIKPAIDWPELSTTVEQITATFRQTLERVNTQIGLQAVEIDFAVAGFRDVLQAVVYELFRLRQSHRGDVQAIVKILDFDSIYQAWLDASASIATTTHEYVHKGEQFKIRTISNPFGRVGIEVECRNERFYVQDMSLACPAANYMRELCESVTEAICRGLITSDL